MVDFRDPGSRIPIEDRDQFSKLGLYESHELLRSSCQGSPGPEKDRKSEIFGSFSGSWEDPWGSEEGRETPKGRKSLIWDRPEGLGEGPGGSEKAKNDEKVLILRFLGSWEGQRGSTAARSWIFSSNGAKGALLGHFRDRFWGPGKGPGGSGKAKMINFHRFSGPGEVPERVCIDFSPFSRFQGWQMTVRGKLRKVGFGLLEASGRVPESPKSRKIIRNRFLTQNLDFDFLEKCVRSIFRKMDFQNLRKV